LTKICSIQIRFLSFKIPHADDGLFYKPHVSILSSIRIRIRIAVVVLCFPKAISSFPIWLFPNTGSDLLVILIGVIVDDVEELELVHTAGGGDDAEPVTKLLLLEELLGPVFPIALVNSFIQKNRGGNRDIKSRRTGT
jgi:hypothetical protein